MVDYAGPLAADLPGIDVRANVGEQWTTGVALVQRLNAEHALGMTVIVGLGTNGPVSEADFHAMLVALSGARRLVFVTVHVNQPWQDSVNALLRHDVAQQPNAVIADWAALSSAHPQWFYSDGTHLPIGGPGASALAALVASTVRKS